MAAHYRTKNRKLILRVLQANPKSSVRAVHLQLEQLFTSQVYRMKTLPNIRQCFRTVADLRDSGVIVADMVGGTRYYSKRSLIT